MSIKQVFKSTLPAIRYIFKNGKEAAFIAGEFLTEIAEEIDQLECEIKCGHPHIFRDTDKLAVDTEADPLAEIKNKIRAELLAEQEAAVRNMGETDAKPTLQGIANTTSIAPASADSNAAPAAPTARLIVPGKTS